MRHLFKARWRQIKNSVGASGKRKYILFVVMGLGMLGLMAYFFFKVFGFLYYEKTFPPVFKLFISEKILTMTFMTMYMMLILSALISALNVFFLSRDLGLLLTSPMRSRTVFLWKSVEVAISSSVMVIFFSMPVLFAYSYYFAPSPANIAAIILVFLLYALSGILIGVIIGLVVPAFFSIKKLEPVLSLVGIALISGIVILLRLLRPEQFGNPDVINNVMAYMDGLNISFLAYFPFSWLASALKYTADGDTAGYWKAVTAFAGTILLLGGLTLYLQRRYYLQLFDKLNKGSKGGYRSRWKKSRLLGRDYGALWKKEVKTFLRSPSQWSQLFIIAAIIIVFVLNLKGIPMPHPVVKHFIAYLNLGMAAFVAAGLNSRFSFPAIPMENPGIINLLASPFKRKKVFRFKLLFFMIPQVIIGYILFFTGDMALHLEPFSRASGIVFLLPVLPFLTVMSLYFSLRIDEPMPLTPQHLLTSRSGISYMLWSLLYVAVGMVYLLRPLYVYYRSEFLQQPTPVWELAAWFGGFILLNLVIMMFLYRGSVSTWNKKEFSFSSV